MSQDEKIHSVSPKPRGLLGRWLGPRSAPTADPDSSEMDLGYESALPWLNSVAGEESAEEAASG